MEINRYLLLCAVLAMQQPLQQQQQHQQNSPAQAKPPRRHQGRRVPAQASIVWTCDICNSCNHDVRMVHPGYKQQFQLWRLPTFCSPAQPIKLPLVQCLLTPAENTLQYFLLPDLGMYIRGILQRRYYSEAIRKHWVKVAASISSSSSPHHNHHQQQAAAAASAASSSSSNHHLHAITRAQWKYMHGLCATLLLESIPCMKRAKRTAAMAAGGMSSGGGGGGGGDHQSSNFVAPDAVEVLACINVLHGTLFKLYPLGAKTPTFNARVNLMRRMLELSSHMSTSEQLIFMQRYPSLVRICFMEYSINALMDWLPCEKVLLFGGGASSCAAAMQTYSNIAVAMCDIFRQDAIITGLESWQALNAAAAVGIERCIRVCKFKLFRAPDPIIRGPHMQPDSFVRESMRMRGLGLDSMDLAMQLFGGDR